VELRLAEVEIEDLTKDRELDILYIMYFECVKCRIRNSHSKFDIETKRDNETKMYHAILTCKTCGRKIKVNAAPYVI
jgi:transcription elongation factor Elf1